MLLHQLLPITFFQKLKLNSMIPLFKLTVTDEFHSDFVYETNDKEKVLDRVALWLAQLDNTPIYNLNIEVNQ
jgi:hypothetical protein